MHELYAILMSWAVTLSGFPAPEKMPEIVPVTHNYLINAACHGQECKVMGWFPPGDKIFVDERLDPLNNLHASSVVVHEMVHYLQYLAAQKGLPFDCRATINLERQAYGVQREYLLKYGVYQPVGVSMHNVGCELAATGEPGVHTSEPDKPAAQASAPDKPAEHEHAAE